MKRRPISPFSLSFLDIMFCGFGAVVLLVLILNADTVKTRNEHFADLRSEVLHLEKQVLTGRENLVAARNSVQTAEQERATTEGDAERVLRLIRTRERQATSLDRETLARREHVNRLASDLQKLETESKRLGEEAEAGDRDGTQVHRFAGEGDRQYLTGLKLGGRRILILLDASASMLDETVVNAIRRRNMDDARKRSAPKWRRARATVEWLIGNLPASARFQLFAFNTEARPVVSDSSGRWLRASSREDVRNAVNALGRLVPQDGTSLYRAFASAADLSPRPDNILLVTDGLPTQGRSRPVTAKVSGEQRLRHFGQAQKVLPSGIPVNTILFPMEGDAYAAAAFWKLAMDTRGSFIAPARDWP